MEIGVCISVISFLLVLLNGIVAGQQYPPVLDEMDHNTDSKEVKCLVCKATLFEMLEQINKIDPKKTVEIGGYHRLDDVKKGKTIQLRRSETYLTDLMENICDNMDDYAKARYKSNSTLTILKLTTPGGGMNPDMSLVDFIQDGDLNKSLKHYCLEVLEDNEEAALQLLMEENIPEDSEIQLCSLAAKYCDDLPAEKDYVLEEDDHDEL